MTLSEIQCMVCASPSKWDWRATTGCLSTVFVYLSTAGLSHGNVLDRLTTTLFGASFEVISTHSVTG